MRKLLPLLGLAAAAWWLVARRRETLAGHVAGYGAGHVVVGYTDGSVSLLEAGSPERELLLGAAAEALRR